MADKKGPLCRLHRLTLVYPKGRLCWFIFLSLSHTMLTYYRNSTETAHITMSGQLASFVPVLDGSNYLEWARLLEAYLKMQSLWAVTSGNWDRLVPKDASNESEHAEEKIDSWDEGHSPAAGTMVLRISPSIIPLIDGQTAPDAWVTLKKAFGTSTPSVIYKDFREAINFRLKPTEPPTPQFSRLMAAYSCLSANKQEVPGFINAMLLLNNLPPKYETISTLVLAGDMVGFEIEKLISPIVNLWESTRKGGIQTANKLSAIKRKRDDPNFQQQQHHSGGSNQNKKFQQQRGNKPQQQQGQGQQYQGSGQRSRHRGKCSGKKFQKKTQDQQGQQGHSHIADTAALAPPTSFTIAHISPTGLEKRTYDGPAPSQHVPGPYKSVNDAIDLAQAIDMPATTQVVKTLEERIGALAEASPWGNNTYVEEWEVESDDTPMHPPSGADTPERSPPCTPSIMAGPSDDEPDFVPLAPPPYHKERRNKGKGKAKDAETLHNQEVIRQWNAKMVLEPWCPPKSKAPTPERAISWGSENGMNDLWWYKG